MQIDTEILKTGDAILHIRGKMTLGEGDELLKDAVNNLIQQGVRNVALNLVNVPYIDSAGLGEIVRSYTIVSRNGGKLVLVGVTKRIEDLLSITKLKTVFEIYETVEPAIKSFGV
jgi:anti-sigma B factor antagonist